MSHIIPPMVSTTPPPLGDTQEEEEEEDFGEFASADYSFHIDGDENESPQHLPSVKDPWPLDDIHKEVNNEEPVVMQVNGIQNSENHDGTDEEEEVEEELKRCTDAKDTQACAPPDNTSQDSVVSANTDSGLCSASEEASPLPPPCGESSDSCPNLQEQNPHLLSQVSSGSEETLVVAWTNHIVAPSLASSNETNSTYLPTNSSCSMLPDQLINNDTSSTTLYDSTTVPTLSSQSINIIKSESQTNCDFEPTTTTMNQSEDFGDFENGVSFVEKDETLGDEINYSNSELSSTIKNEFNGDGEGVPFSDFENDFGDYTNATSNLSLSSLPTDTPPENEISSNTLDNLQSIAVNQTNTIPDDSLSFGDFESVSSELCNKNDVTEVSSDKSKEYDNFENNTSSFENNDDFGDFENVSGANKNQDINGLDTDKDNINISLKSTDDNLSGDNSFSKSDEFCEFESVPPLDSKTIDEDDFGDFEVAAITDDSSQPWVESQNTEDGFADFSSAPQADEGWAEPFTEPSTTMSHQGEDDDFDDFTSAEESAGPSQPCGADLVSLMAQLFPVNPSTAEVTDDGVPPPLSSWLPTESGTSSSPSIWPALRDVQSTPALDYQWGSSNSHTRLLGALGIDSRNILFGQRWNANMPRFAANLGQNPLEPMRADMGASNSSGNSNPSPNTLTSGSEEVVPAAQFDWTGSGLVNPLDSASKQAEEATMQQQKKGVEPALSSDIILEPVKSDVILEPTLVKPEIILDVTQLSSAARVIISSLPDLSYMRAGQLKHKSIP